MIGGSGEKKTLRLVAQYADACNLFGASPTRSRTSSTCCAGHCDDRRPRLRRRSRRRCSRGGDPLADVDAFVDQMAAYAALGIETVALSGPGADCADWVRELGDKVVPRLAEL